MGHYTHVLEDVRWHPGVYWYVIRTHWRQESRAELGLRAEGLTTFLPRLRRRRGRLTAAADAEPLFPQYLFGRFDAEASLRLVSYMRGVQSVVTLGGYLATIDGDSIALLESHTGSDGCISPGHNLHRGDHVRIDSGPLMSLRGVIEHELPARTRVAILLTNLSANVHVQVPVEWVSKSYV
jgi:transcriptional antiterminator RfaH